MNYLNENSGAIVAIATIVLAIITTLYLWETKKTRSILKNSLDFERNKSKIENQPIVYIKEVMTYYDFTKGSTSEFSINPSAKIVNEGKTPADNINIQHRIYAENMPKPDYIRLEGNIKIYPGQNTFIHNNILSNIGVEEVNELSNEYKTTNKFLNAPKIPHSIYWEIIIEFTDIYDQEYVERFRWKYNYPQWEFKDWIE